MIRMNGSNPTPHTIFRKPSYLSSLPSTFETHFNTTGTFSFNCSCMITVTLTTTGRDYCVVKLLLSNMDHSKSHTGEQSTLTIPGYGLQPFFFHTQLAKTKKVQRNIYAHLLYLFVFYVVLFNSGVIFNVCLVRALLISAKALHSIECLCISCPMLL